MPRRSAARRCGKLRQQLGRPRIGGGGDQLGQHRRIAQPQIEALRGDRMQRLRGIADQRHARADCSSARTSASG